MNKGDKQLREFAKKLVLLSLDADRQPTEERVKGVLEALAAKPPAKYRTVLKLYQHYLKRELKACTATVEHAGELSASALKDIETQLTSSYGRKITAVAKANDDLIAGVRVGIADDVIDDSVAGRLTALAAQVR